VEAGVKTVHIAFPQYGNNAFAEVVSEYLNGTFGGVDDVHPKLASLLFAGDRFASKSILLEAIQSNSLVICDRYIASNLAHQAAKLPTEQRSSFMDWLHRIEFGIYGMPKPDLTIYLDVPVDTARKMVDKKPARDQFDLFGEETQGAYTTLKQDIHEQNASYLANCRELYDYLIEQNIAGPWERISCLSSDGQTLRPAPEISLDVWNAVRVDLLKSGTESGAGHAVS